MRISSAFVCIVIIFGLVSAGSLLQETVTSVPWFSIILGYILSIIADFLVKKYAITGVKKVDRDSALKHIKFPNIFILLISCGYALSKIYKKSIRPDQASKFCSNNRRLDYKKHFKGVFISRANKGNLILSAGFLLSLSILEIFNLNDSDKIYYQTLTCLIIFRVLSRSFEITYAFTNDVLTKNNGNNSNLDKYDRVKLALNSYIENVLNFGAVYYFFNNGTVGHSILSSVGTATVSNINSSSCYFEFVLVNIQVLTSLALVVLSLAIYVSRNK